MIEVQHYRLLGTLPVSPPTHRPRVPMTDEDIANCRAWLADYVADRRRRGIPPTGTQMSGEHLTKYELHELETAVNLNASQKQVADSAGAWLANYDLRDEPRTPDRAALVVAVGAMLQHGHYGILGAVLDEFDVASGAAL